jgi:hypothetical protein
MLGCNLLLNLCHFAPNIRLICDPEHCGDGDSCCESAPQGIVRSPRSRCGTRRRLNFASAFFEIIGSFIGADRRRHRLRVARQAVVTSIVITVRGRRHVSTNKQHSATETAIWRLISSRPRSPTDATRLFTCCSQDLGLFLFSIGIGFAALPAVISNLGHPLKKGYLGRPELRRRRACSHSPVVGSCCADERALLPCETCLFLRPLFRQEPQQSAPPYSSRVIRIFSLARP